MCSIFTPRQLTSLRSDINFPDFSTCARPLFSGLFRASTSTSRVVVGQRAAPRCQRRSRTTRPRATFRSLHHTRTDRLADTGCRHGKSPDILDSLHLMLRSSTCPGRRGAGMNSPTEPEARDQTAAAAPKSSSKTRKRHNPSSGGAHAGQSPPKRPKTAVHSGPLQVPNAVQHAVLAQYYPTTLPLRQYLLDNLPVLSRLRRKKIAAVGSEPLSTADREPDGVRAQLARLLDTTLVGLHVAPKNMAKAQSERRLQQWIDYSQRDDSHMTLSGGGDASAVHFQSEVGLNTVVRGQESSRAFMRHASVQG